MGAREGVLVHDVVIIGGGPAGLTAGVYCRMRKLSVLVVDAGRVGGQLVSLYADKPVHDWPGYHEVIAGDLAEDIVSHARAIGVEIVEDQKVTDLVRREDGFELKTEDALTKERRTHEGRTVIIAIGAGASEPRRMKVPGEDGLTEEQLTYRMPEPARVAGRRVVVVGGGDSGLESAQAAHRAGAKVTIVHTHGAFSAMEANIEAVDAMKIPRVLDARVRELVIEDGRLRGMAVHVRGEPEPRRLECDYVVVNIGSAVNLDAVKRWGVEIEGGQVKVDSRMQTSVPGVFACGDIVTYEGKYKLLITASSEGAVAANSAYVHVRKPQRLTMGDLYI